MLKTKQELALEAIAMAETIGVPPALVCSIIEVSSHWDQSMMEWNPTPWLRTEHPVDVGGEDNWMILGTRWGLMQVLGQEAFMTGSWMHIESLPDNSLEAGCRLLRHTLDHQKDEKSALIIWFGAERKSLAGMALALLPDYQRFVEMKPCASGS